MKISGGVIRTVVVDQGSALVDGKMVSGLEPESLRGDAYVAAIYALQLEAAQTGRDVRAVAHDASGRTHLVIHQDGTVSGARSPARTRLVVAGIAAVVVAAVALAATSSTPEDPAKDPAPAAPRVAAPMPSDPPAAPINAPRDPVDPRRAAAVATPSVGQVTFKVRATRRPVTATIRVTQAGVPAVTKTVRLRGEVTSVRIPARPGRAQWAVRVEGVAPIRGALRVPAPPRPEAPAPDPVQPPGTSSPPETPAAPPDDEGGSGGDGGDSNGGGNGGGGNPPPPPLNGGNPPPVPTG